MLRQSCCCVRTTAISRRCWQGEPLDGEHFYLQLSFVNNFSCCYRCVQREENSVNKKKLYQNM